MENVQKKKIKIAVEVSVISVVLVAFIIVLCILFVPRKLSSELPLDNIEKISIEEFLTQKEDGTSTKRDLTQEEINLFIEYAKNTKIRYSRGGGMIKGRGPIIFDIYYKDGSSASFQRFRMHVKDKDGDFKINSELAENDFDFAGYYKSIFKTE